MLPLIFAAEAALSGVTRFDTYQTIEVGASPAAVWRALLHMDTIEDEPGLPFRLGVAHPVRGDIIGEGGVGAVRHGEFSTGIAIERVTEWVPQRKLAFIVIDDVPAMRELSPYELHTPHLVGYFRTLDTSFELVPRGEHRTEIIERTTHELRLEPVLYWLPLARWVVAHNNARVLSHIRRQAERNGS